MIKAVWITDIHLSDSTLKVGISSLNQARTIAEKHNVPLIIGGDIFTSRKSQSLSVLKAFKGFIKRYGKLSSCPPLIIIPGNNDKTD